MPEKFSTEQRSAIMRRVRSVDTDPERKVRQMVHRLGLRFRLHAKKLPGTPDLVFSGRRQAILVHGCFWHQHHCAAAKRPASNRRYWNEKQNISRDKENLLLLKAAGLEGFVTVGM